MALPGLEHVEVDGIRIAYRRAGHGPPVVLLHGGISDSREWEEQIAVLSDGFEVVAWDAPGCGGSSDPPTSFRIGEYANCLAGLVSRLELEPPHVVGLSFGSVVALELARGRPTVPRSLVLASAYAGWKGSLPPDVVAARLKQIERDLELEPDAFVRPWLPTLFTERAQRPMVERLAAVMSDFHPAGARAMAAAMAEADLRDVLPSIDVPTLLVVGAEDVRSPLDVVEELHAAIPGSQLVVLPDVGHQCNVEAADRFNAEVGAFLRLVKRPQQLL